MANSVAKSHGKKYNSQPKQVHSCLSACLLPLPYLSPPPTTVVLCVAIVVLGVTMKTNQAVLKLRICLPLCPEC